MFQIINPKSWVLVTTAITAMTAESDAVSSLLVLAVLLLCITSACLSLWALAGAVIAGWLLKPGTRGWFDRVTGGLLMGSSLLLLL